MRRIPHRSCIIPGGAERAENGIHGSAHLAGSPSRACGAPGMTPKQLTRRGALGSLLAIVATPALAHPPMVLSPDSTKAIEGEARAFYRALRAAVAAKDAAALRGMYADSFHHTHTSARTDGKDARIVSLLAGDATVELLADIPSMTISIHAGGWAAAVRGVTPIRAADGKTYAVHWLQMLARRGDEAWQLVASQATRGAETAP